MKKYLLSWFFALYAIVFFMDPLTPLFVAVGIAYLMSVFIGYKLPNTSVKLAIRALFILLTIACYLISSKFVGPGWITIIYILISIICIGDISFFEFRYKPAEECLSTKEPAFQNVYREKRTAWSMIADKEPASQNEKNPKLATQRNITNKKLSFQDGEARKRTGVLGIDHNNAILSKGRINFSIRQKLLLFAFIILTGNGAIGYAVYKSNKIHLDSEQKMHHTEEVIQLSGNILSLTKDIETASRGFVITGDTTFLEPLNTAEKKISLFIANLRQLTLDNPRQEQRIDSFNLYFHELLFFSKYTVELRSKQGLPAVIIAFSTRQGKIYYDKMGQIIDAIQKEETSLLRQQKQVNKKSVSVLGWFTEIMFVFMITFTILLLIATGNYMYQNEEKEKRAAELIITNMELTTFNFVTSHDLQEPLRKIKNFVSVLLKEEENKLSEDGKKYLQRMYDTAKGMQVLLEDLIIYANTKNSNRKFEKTDLTEIVEEVKKDFEEIIFKKKATINVTRLCEANIIRFQFRQLFQNLINNSLKFSKTVTAPHINIKSEIVNGAELKNQKLLPKIYYCHIIYTDNGIGFDPKYNDRIFEVFQRLNSKEEYEGTGMGLAICKRIVANHNGIITASGELNKGARFDIYIPVK